MLQLTAQKRDILGKKVKNLLEKGLIPAEVYGPEIENIHISVVAKDFVSIFNQVGENSLINLMIENKIYPVIIHDVQEDFLRGGFKHIDFYLVRMDRKIKAHISLSFEGVSLAVKEKGGVLVKSVEKVEVEALPQDLPHTLTVDLSLLDEIHKSIHIKDIKVSSGVKILVDPETVVATVIEKAQEEVEEIPPSEEKVTEGEKESLGANNLTES